MSASQLVISERAKAIVRVLADAHRPKTAIELAAVINVKGAHETLRRRVREAVDHAREPLGYRVCASGDGYWLARDATEWANYRATQKSGARFAFVKMRKTQEAVTDRMGKQRRLFPG